MTEFHPARVTVDLGSFRDVIEPTEENPPVSRYVCRTCKRPYSPTHDTTAPGPTSRHPYDPPDDEPITGEILDGHALLRDETPGGLGRLYCSCLRWEAVVTGYRSGEWARMEYREHAARANLAK